MLWFWKLTPMEAHMAKQSKKTDETKVEEAPKEGSGGAPDPVQHHTPLPTTPPADEPRDDNKDGVPDSQQGGLDPAIDPAIPSDHPADAQARPAMTTNASLEDQLKSGYITWSDLSEDAKRQVAARSPDLIRELGIDY